MICHISVNSTIASIDNKPDVMYGNLEKICGFIPGEFQGIPWWRLLLKCISIYKL